MDLRRLRVGEWVTAGCGLLLGMSLFLPWYEQTGAGGALDLTAWEAFAVLDLLLLLLAALAVGLLIVTAVQPTAAVGIAADALLTLVAGAIAIPTVFRLLNPPGDLERGPFAWVGLAAVLGVLTGTVLAMRDERLSKPGERTDATGVPMAAPPEVEVFPAPPRGSPDE